MNNREELIYFFEKVRGKSRTAYKQDVLKSINNTYVYDELPFDSDNFQKKKINIEVTNGSSVETALEYSTKRVAILNFASAYRPGGGVTNGAIAQEEVLCRCSTLYEVLSSKKCIDNYYRKNKNDNYKYGSDRIIYSPNIIFFNTDKNNPPKKIEPFTADVITCAAPNLRNKEYDLKQLEEVLLKRYRKIFVSACINNIEILVLGAIGCGVFQNPANIVAKAMKQLCIEFPYFEKAVFPIYRSSELLEAFEKTMKI